MDPMRYLREKAEARAFARQGKELPKGQAGIFTDNVNPNMQPNLQTKMDDAAAALANKWDAMSLREKHDYVTQSGPKYAEPYFPGQNAAMTKKNVVAAYNKATRR
jgi:hypothetical protein